MSKADYWHKQILKKKPRTGEFIDFIKSVNGMCYSGCRGWNSNSPYCDCGSWGVEWKIDGDNVYAYGNKVKENPDFAYRRFIKPENK